MATKFTQKENGVLSETLRRLHEFHKGNVETPLLLLSHPPKVSSLISKGIFEKPVGEIPKCSNWYSLTKKGKELFKVAYGKHKLDEQSSLAIFNGYYVIDFNPILENLA